MTVLGVPQLLARFDRAAALGEVAAVAGRDVLGQDVEVTAKSLVRVDTGALQDSITYADGKVTAGEGLDDGRAVANEYGTRNMSSQPYMRPAADTANGDRASEVAAAVMRRA